MTSFKQNLIDTLNNFDNSDIEHTFFTGEFTLEESNYEYYEYYDECPVVRGTLIDLGVTGLENLQSVGGCEGDGETRFEVYSFTDGEEVLFVKFDGYYQSYDGSTYQSWSFVSPKEKVVIVYE